MIRNQQAKAQSVCDRLNKLARQSGVDFQVLFVRYLNEGFLARIAQTPYKDHLILKGGLSLVLVHQLPFTRPTKDIDFLGRGIKNDPQECAVMIRQICQIVLEDGLHFDDTNLKVEIITETADYPGLRVKLAGYLDKATHAIQVDIGFSDVTVPAQPRFEYLARVFDSDPKIYLRVYSLETLIAEKYEALIKLGQQNSRSKDVYDLYMVCSARNVEGAILRDAIKQTFDRRQTSLILTPFAFQSEYLADGEKQKQWSAMLKRSRLQDTAPSTIETALHRVKLFLTPITEALIEQREWNRVWDCQRLMWVEKMPEPISAEDTAT